MRKYIDYLLALIPAFLVFLLISLNPFYSLQAMVGDLLTSQKNGTGDTIKIIAIDEKTLAEYGPMNEWSREKSALLAEMLMENERTSPKVLAYDIMFVGEKDEATDSALVNALTGLDNVVVASHLVYRGQTKYGVDGSPYYDGMHVEMEELPYDRLEKQVDYGFANVQVAKDGFVRDALLYDQVEGQQRYSFAAQIYRCYLEQSGQNVQLPTNAQSTHFFYSGNPGEFIHYSLVDVLEGRIPATEFSDCIVMVGAYAPGLNDSFHTPAKRSKEMYGVEINANIVRALMAGKLAQNISRILLAFAAAVILYIYTFLARRMKMYPALLIGVWIVLAQGIIGRILATKGYLLGFLYLPLVLILVMAWVIIEKYVIEAVNKRRVLNTFRKYMAPQVIDKMAKEGNFHIELGGTKREVAVLFVDIRGFTSMSEKLDPETVVQILNQYLTLTSTCIFNHGGMLDKFVGDATMAIFNAPNDQEDYLYEAVMTAKDMQKYGTELGEKLFEQYGERVGFGVGVHFGDAVIGNIGSDFRMDYTAIGDTVNTAARLESKALAGEILISEKVYLQLSGRIEAEYKEPLMLKGKAEPVNVYCVK